MKAKSIIGKSRESIATSLNESLKDGFKPALAVVFMSVKIDRMEIASLLGSYNIQVFGATTNGEFIDDSLGSGSVAIMLLDLDPTYFHIYMESYKDLQFRNAGQRIARKAKKKINNPGFIIAGSHLSTDAEESLRGFQDECGKEVTVFGGMAGDDFAFQNQYVFSNTKEDPQGMIGLAIDLDKVEVKGYALCGWKAMGTEKTVTKSEGNHVYTIEGVPALDIMAKYGGISNVSENNEDLLLEMATMCPLQLQREGAPAIMRPSLMVDWNDHSTFSSGTVPQGSKVKFCLPPDFDAIEEVIHGCEALRDNDIPKVDAIIYFTCAGRLMTFGPLMEKEIEGIKEVWNAPLVGMFSNAELGRAKGGDLELHNLSTCCVVLKEKG